MTCVLEMVIMTQLKQVRPSSAALADLDRLYAQFSTSETEDSSSGQEERGDDNTKNFLGWEKLLAKAEAEAPDSFCQENTSTSDFNQDPSFCSGKISARFIQTRRMHRSHSFLCTIGEMSFPQINFLWWKHCWQHER